MLRPPSILDAMNKIGDMPWPLRLLLRSRAAGRMPENLGRRSKANRETAQEVLLHRARMNGAAALGEWDEDEENG